MAHFTLDGAPRYDTQVPHEVAPVEGEPTQFSRDDFEVDERRIIILMAGVEAESILTHDEDWWESEEDRIARGGDYHDAAAYADGSQRPSMSMSASVLLAHEDMARRCWSLFQYRTRQLMRQSPLQSAVIALANALLAEERIDAARTARIIRTGIAEADPDLIG